MNIKDFGAGLKGIIQNMAKKTGELASSAGETIRDKAAQSAGHPRMKIRICMLGARGVGKTSIITSMYNSMSEAVTNTGLFLSASMDTQIILNSKLHDLNSIYQGHPAKGDLIAESGIEGDASESVFEFTYGFNKEKINIDLEIRDYPGEYLKDRPDTVADFIREASAVLIAIDTPCLMEEGGRYQAAKNRLDLVSEFLIKHMDSESEKLLLLVPLKCEKYCLEGRIDEVTDRVKKYYGGLIEHFRDREDRFNFKKKVCCAITPIQTLGTVAFHDFGRDANGEVIEIMGNDGMALPREQRYEYAVAGAQYRPRNCEQPLYYLLSFISKQYSREIEAKKTSGIIGRLMKSFSLVPKVEEFFIEIQTLASKRIDSGQGYKILYGKGRI